MSMSPPSSPSASSSASSVSSASPALTTIHANTTSWCSKLSQCIQYDLNWTPKIVFPCTTQFWSKTDADTLPFVSSSGSTIYVDIVQLLHNNHTYIDHILYSHSEYFSKPYPKNAVFCIANESSDYPSDNHKPIANYVKHISFQYGTELYTETVRKKRKDMILSCCHFGTSRSKKSKNSPLYPNDKCIQIGSSIVQPLHKRSSFKGSSSSKFLQNTKSTTTNNTSLRKTSTSKVGCSFTLRIQFDSKSKAWYIMRNKVQSSVIAQSSHTNHFPIPTNLLLTKKHQLDTNVLEAISHQIKQGASTSAIAHSISAQFNVNVSSNLIIGQRDTIINDLIGNFKDYPVGTAVDRLLKIFSSLHNVSYVYVTHNMNSGFVTCRKTKKNNATVNTTTNSTSCTGVTNTAIHNWRESLKLQDSNDILVAFAWCHDEEIRKAEMFPEFLAMDVTFGVNKQRREEFVVAGIDGNMKVFTAFRCFMPSKQHRAYRWVINVALPFLLSDTALEYTNLVASDNEDGIVLSIDELIKDDKSKSFSHAKHRLDFYHIFLQDWFDKVRHMMLAYTLLFLLHISLILSCGYLGGRQSG